MSSELRPRALSLIFRLTICGLLLGCRRDQPATAPESDIASPPSSQDLSFLAVTGASSNAAQTNVPMYSYEVVHAFPHDRRAFTQGLIFLDGDLLESTGEYGTSSLRRVELESGRVAQQTALSSLYFAEGIAVLGRKIYQLTWQNGKCFVYDLQTFQKQGEFSYTGEGWGLTTDDRQQLIMSDGTDRLRILNPDTFEVKQVVKVTKDGKPLGQLNEIEFIKGEIFANVWRTDFIVRIAPATGKVTGVLDLSGLLSPSERSFDTDVLNGIAYDRAGDRLFVTGKRWPKLFEIKLKPK